MGNFLSYSKKNPVPLTPKPDAQIKLHFPTDAADGTLMKGTVVTLGADGKVKVCTNSDVPLGRIVVAKSPYKREGCTVVLMHGAGMMGQAAAALAPGDLLTATGSADGVTTFAKTGTYVSALALSEAASGEELDVLLFNSPFKR
jgi:hypothetical protein